MLRDATRHARRGRWFAIARLAALLVGPAIPAGARHQPRMSLDGDQPEPSDGALDGVDAGLESGD